MSEYLTVDFLDGLAAHLRSLGRWAKEKQQAIQRSYKADGSVITEVDLAISNQLIEYLDTHAPWANIVSEENETPFDPDAPWTFVIDPIDGTDIYSQGMPSWAVALGILDAERQPVGALISSPRMGLGVEELFVRLDPGKELLINDAPFAIQGQKDVPLQVTIGSAAQQSFDFSRYEGRLRTFGSAILHLLGPIIYPYVQGTVVAPCHAWDIAASHAVMRHVGMDLVYCEGIPFVYDDRMLIERESFYPALYGGTPACITALCERIPLKQEDR